MNALRKAARVLAQGVLPAVVLLAAFVVTRALIGGDDAPAPRAPRAADEIVYAVRAQDVVLGDNRATYRAFGEVEAVGAAELRVASPGEVVAVADDLAVGEIVEAGTALVTIDPFEYEGAVREAKAQLAEARARLDEINARVSMEDSAVLAAADQLDFAQRDLDRANRLSTSGNLADRALDDRRLLVSQREQALNQSVFTLEAERARLAQQEAAVERLEWQVERAERALQDTVLTAPFRAIVRAESAEVGRLLAANDIAAYLIRADALDIAFTLSDQRYGRLLADGPVRGTPVEVIWRIGDQPRLLSATITRTAADIDPATGGVRLFARVDAAVGAANVLPRPGAFVEVNVDGPVQGETVRLPASALYGDAVFVIGADERLEQRAVRLAARDGEDVIVSGQLSDGDAVMTTRLAEAGAGIKVKRVGDAPPAPPALAANDPGGDDADVPGTSPADTPATAAPAAPAEPSAAATVPAPAAAEPQRRSRRGPPAAGSRGAAESERAS